VLPPLLQSLALSNPNSTIRVIIQQNGPLSGGAREHFTVIPALVNLGIGILLSTPLVAVIGMTDFLSAAKEAASHEQEWPGCYNVAYFVIASVFFCMCFSASRYSQWLERRLRAGGNVLVKT